MDSDIQQPHAENPRAADDLIRRLSRRYLFVLLTVAGLAIVDQVIIQPLLVQLSWYAPVINVAGRQRMLSQRLTKAALSLEVADNDVERSFRREELHQTLEQWSTAHAALREGRPEQGIQRIESPEIDGEWQQLSCHFDAMCAAAEVIVADGSADPRNGKVVAAATKAIVAHEGQFLASMERIVTIMENEAAGAAFRLRVCAATIAAAVIALLLLLGRFVVRPAIRTIRGQIENLESQVATRTQELTSTLAALRFEMAERERSESNTRRLAAQLAHAERVWTMGHLATGLAHELNQPLATIANYSEACEVELASIDGNVRTNRLRKYVDSTKQAALRAGKIVRRMRNFVQPNATSKVQVELDSLISEVVELCRTEAEQLSADIGLEIADESAMVVVDPIQIQQVLVNLVQNALQAMYDSPLDRRRIEIRMMSHADDEFIQIDVTDSGPGFVADDADQIFEPFHTTKPDGLGIGLSICRAIVEDHGGHIWAESATGRGTRVSFTLPISQSDVARGRIQSECVCSR